jgi:hypothetical protein
VLDALAFERDREAELLAQLEDTVADADGSRLDDEVFAQMDADEVELVREALGGGPELEFDEETEEDAFDVSFDDAGAEDEGDPVEDELARLQAEVESSRRIQAALERYAELLSQDP